MNTYMVMLTLLNSKQWFLHEYFDKVPEIITKTLFFFFKYKHNIFININKHSFLGKNNIDN